VSTLGTPTNSVSKLNNLNTFTKKTGSNNVKLPKVGWNAIVPVPVGAGPNKRVSSHKKNENGF
jgi:imidazoleglycerol phosphate synthase glutamine amidotransferase subunit HisH